jgi:hypothetical protein
LKVKLCLCLKDRTWNEREILGAGPFYPMVNVGRCLSSLRFKFLFTKFHIFVQEMCMSPKLEASINLRPGPNRSLAAPVYVLQMNIFLRSRYYKRHFYVHFYVYVPHIYIGLGMCGMHICMFMYIPCLYFYLRMYPQNRQSFYTAVHPRR